MSNNFCIGNNDKFPPTLTKEEIVNLFNEFYSGSQEAKEKLILHNLRLVSYRVYHRFKNVDYDKKELISIGQIALIKAVNTFDLNKGVDFSSYAITCIDNAIKYSLRKQNKKVIIDSLEEVVYSNRKDIKLIDTIESDVDIEEEYITKEKQEIVKAILESLAPREREIIKLYFGFYGKNYKQNEISLALNISQSLVSFLIRRTIDKIRRSFNELGYDISSIKKNKKSK